MFVTRLNQQIKAKNSRVCVGLDPRLEWLPVKIKERNEKKYGKNFQAAAKAIEEFGKEVIDVVAPWAAAVKPQLAFFEQYGPAGLASFKAIVEFAQQKDLLVIADAKRSDIDSTAQAYANTFLGETTVFGQKQAVYDVDAMTVNPFLGMDSLLPFIQTSRQYDKGLLVLVKTSNPGSKDLQDLKVSGQSQTVSQTLAQLLAQLAQEKLDDQGYSDLGVVVGATFPKEALSLRKLLPHSVFLVPGIGAQGGEIETLGNFFNADGLGAIVNSSRGIVFSQNGQEGDDYLSLIESKVKEFQQQINRVLEK